MNMQTQLKLCAYALAMLGFWAVTLTEYFPSIWPTAATIFVCVSWFSEKLPLGNRAYRRLWIGLGVGMLLFFPIDFVLSRNLLLPAVHMSMFGLAYLLSNPKNLRAYRYIFAVSFAQMLASAILMTDIIFAVILTAYCLAGVYGVILLQLLKNLQDPHESNDRTINNQKAPQGLLFSSLGWTLLLAPLTAAFFFGGPRLEYRVIGGSNEAEVLDRIRIERLRTGFSETVQLGTFGRVQEDLTLALRVEMPEEAETSQKVLRWRGGALNIYGGSGWDSSRDYFAHYNGRQWIMTNKNSGTIFPRENNLFILDERYAQYRTEQQLDSDPRMVKQICYLEIPYSERIFGADEIKAIIGPFKYGIEQDFNRSFSIRNRQGLPEFITYTVYSEIREPPEAQLKQVSFREFEDLVGDKDYGNYVRTHFLQLPDNLDPRIRRLTLEITEGAVTPYEKISAIKDFLEDGYKYSLDLGRPATDDPVSNFLFVSKEGHCEYFASAMTLMTRLIGIPARLANGFQKGEWNDTGQFYEVRQRDAHVWTEVYFPGYGWRAFDPSPRVVADEYFERSRSPIARALSKRMLMLQIGWRRYIVGYNQSQRMNLFSEIRKLIFHDGPRAAVALLGKFIAAFTGSHVIHRAAALFLVLLLIAASFLYRKNMFSPSSPWPIRLIRRGKRTTPFYERMLSLLAKQKITKSPFATSLEFLEFPALQRHPMLSEMEHLTSLYYRVRFGGMRLTDEDAASIADILKRLRKSS